VDTCYTYFVRFLGSGIDTTHSRRITDIEIPAGSTISIILKQEGIEVPPGWEGSNTE